MITIILFILIGLKLEMGAAYWCIVGIAAALVVIKGLMQICEAVEQHKEKQKIVKELDAMIDKLEKNRDKFKSSLKREKEEENEEKKKAEEYGFCELKDTENWEPAYKAGVWEIDKARKAKVDREQNENQEETKHE